MTFTSHKPLEWKVSQVFGESCPGEEIQDVDVVSTLEFEKQGDYLAVGDQGGRVVIFERKDGKQTPNGYLCRNELEQLDSVTLHRPEYQYKMEFQSHEPEVKDQKVKKGKEIDLHQHIFSENTLLAERSIISEQHLPSFTNGNYLGWKEDVTKNLFSSQELHTKIANNEDTAYARCWKVYANAHDFNVNSISYNR